MQNGQREKRADNAFDEELLERAKDLNGSDLRVCAFCINQGRERCITECVPEGKGRYLEPKRLERWDRLPKQPRLQDAFDHSGGFVTEGGR